MTTILRYIHLSKVLGIVLSDPGYGEAISGKAPLLSSHRVLQHDVSLKRYEDHLVRMELPSVARDFATGSCVTVFHGVESAYTQGVERMRYSQLSNQDADDENSSMCRISRMSGTTVACRMVVIKMMMMMIRTAVIFRELIHRLSLES